MIFSSLGIIFWHGFIIVYSDAHECAFSTFKLQVFVLKNLQPLFFGIFIFYFLLFLNLICVFCSLLLLLHLPHSITSPWHFFISISLYIKFKVPHSLFSCVCDSWNSLFSLYLCKIKVYIFQFQYFELVNCQIYLFLFVWFFFFFCFQLFLFKNIISSIIHLNLFTEYFKATFW